MAEIKGIGENFVQQAFLGEKIDDKRHIEEAIKIANNVNKILLEPDLDKRDNLAVNFANNDIIKPDIQVTDSFGLVDYADKYPDGNTPGSGMNKEYVGRYIDGIYLAMRDGGNKDCANALSSGSDAQIIAALPEQLKGFGREISQRVITNTDVSAVLTQADQFARENMWEDLTPSPEDVKAQFVIAEAKLRSLGATIKTEERPQLVRALRYVRVMQNIGEEKKVESAPVKPPEPVIDKETKEMLQKIAVNTGKVPPVASSHVEEYLRQMAELEKSQAELRTDIAETALTEQLHAYLNISAPRERTPQQWEYTPPEWARSFSRDDWRDLLSMEDTLLGAVHRKRNGTENASFKSIVESWAGMVDVKDKDFHQWLNDPRLKLFDVMHFISKELLVPKVFTETVDGVTKTSKIYVFETVMGEDKEGKPKLIYSSSKVNALVTDQTKYKLELADRLVLQGVTDNINLAKMSVAMAMDIMELGGVFSGADKLRLLTWEADNVRFAQQPTNKIEGKILGNEIVGGPWGVWAKSISETDAEAMELLRKLKVVPQLLCGSFWDVSRDGNVSWADKIYNGTPLDKSSKYSGIFFNWRKDSLAPACDVMSYLTQKSPLQTNKVMTVEDQVSQWMPTLRNAILSLRNNGVSLLSTDVVCAAIGASTNIYPTRGHYLRIAEPNNEFSMNYRTIGNQILEGLILSSTEMQHIRKFYGLDGFWALNKANQEVLQYGMKLKLGLSVKKGQK